MIPAPPPPAGLANLGRAQARLVWSVIAIALVAAVVGALVGAAAVPMPGGEQLGTPFLLVAGVLVPVDLAVSFLVTSRMRRRASPDAPRDAVAATQVIVGAAVALGAGAICCVFYFVSRQPLLLLLVLPCAAVLVHWFPSQSRWAALAPAPAPGEPRRSALVRE